MIIIDYEMKIMLVVHLPLAKALFPHIHPSLQLGFLVLIFQSLFQLQTVVLFGSSMSLSAMLMKREYRYIFLKDSNLFRVGK